MTKVRKQLSLETIEAGLKDSDCDVRQAAMNACQGRDVPLTVIEAGLKDSDWSVRQAAMNACVKNGYPIPVIRTIEPPETVYKKCVGDVIVCATIPETAQVRGKKGSKCRASAAHITEIIGTFGGESVGISVWDKKTTYFVGDDVLIEDYDMSDEECSQGFHFFCTIEEAKKY